MLFSIKNHKIWKWKKIGNLIISCIIYHYYLLFYYFYWFIFCLFIKPVLCSILFKIYVLERCGATWWCKNDCIKFVITRTELFLLFFILVIFIHQSFLQYISFHSIRAIQRETERNSGLGSSWSSFCGTLSLISQLIYDDIVKMFHMTAGNG